MKDVQTMAKIKKKNKGPKKDRKSKPSPAEPLNENEKLMDFGVSPVRDLKKNLGCG